MTRKKKHRILLEPDQDNLLIAIASHEKGYHLSWILNHELGTHFTRSTDFQIVRKQTNLIFPVFAWEDENKMLSYHLLSNRSESGFLFGKLKNIDFFLHVLPKPGEKYTHYLESRLKNIPVIYACFLINPIEYPTANILQFD